MVANNIIIFVHVWYLAKPMLYFGKALPTAGGDVFGNSRYCLMKLGIIRPRQRVVIRPFMEWVLFVFPAFFEDIHVSCNRLEYS